jgi:copper(I)-binding protein
MRLVKTLMMGLVAAGTVSTAAAQGAITASAAWVAEPAPGATATSAYALVENPSMYDIYVVSVTSDVAASAELANGPADTATTLSDLAVPAYGRTELKPGGVHIRLKELSRTLKAGETVALTLTTDQGTIIKVDAAVKKN